MGILPKSSYYDHQYRQSAALLRARQPYLVKNLITGACLFAFTIGVYSLTFKLVGQDDFEDVKGPKQPVQPAHAPNASAVTAAALPSSKKSQ